MQGFRDEVSVVTGAGSGIGRALALDLARAGARVEVSDVVGDAAEKTAIRARELGAWAKAVELDVTDRAAMEAYAHSVEDEHGRVDLMINNAGAALAALVTEQQLEDVFDVLDVNLRGVIQGTQIFLPALQRAPAGRLVNISSLFGLVPMPFNSAYAASKFGVRGFTETLAMELDIAGSPVTVSCVHPGGVDTGIIDNAHIPPGNEELAEASKRVLRKPPERAARTILRAVARHKRRVLVGADAWTVHLAHLLLGPGFHRVVATGARHPLLRARTASLTKPGPDRR